MDTATPYEIVLDVQPEDIDEQHHVNNVVYLKWVQEAATAHWAAQAPEAAQEALFWVVLRHEIDYKKAALPGDRIVVRTWVGTASRSSFERHTEILRAADRVLLARARTLWCPMSRVTGRPVRVEPEVRAAFSVAG